MSKKIIFNFKGYSTICFVSFYNEHFKEDLDKIEKDNFDHLDFLQEHELNSFWLGKGMNNESDPNPTVEILENDIPIQLKSNDVFIYDGDYSNEDDQKNFEELNGFKYDEVLTGSYASMQDLGYDENYLANTSDYKFAVIEKFQPDEAKASIVIDADDDYSIKDFEIIWLDFDSNGFAGEVYSYTGLEKEIVGIKYKDKIYDLEPGEHKGPGSEYIYFEKFDDTFEQSYDIGDKISELNW